VVCLIGDRHSRAQSVVLSLAASSCSLAGCEIGGLSCVCFLVCGLSAGLQGLSLSEPCMHRLDHVLRFGLVSAALPLMLMVLLFALCFVSS
jgi:hypothetical protein